MGLPAGKEKVRSLSRLRERAGERVSPQSDSLNEKNPHPALRADLSRKRERLRGLAARSLQTNFALTGSTASAPAAASAWALRARGPGPV
ncbi:hypothetical protein BRDID11004_18000 [Bradyrhizobium diazoefficiens]|uniref:Uncharacterized protein n=1 Tax=Bradyrhizobium diazoefficiens TaxID=1355477 RepID=A0A810AVY7_9BRAD|nr:hypothetical protein F07S3_71200 [Bradyrhizobium diazoefficiens]BCA06363.1 hypothetical protein H12S4_72670 [Bradyrhizobium diazoefficiens]BCA14973.1 hypothetical protein BDHF08_68200 [Bradyrhizobium diazoefficiens]BCA23714.1 hypothetical protein BDHH15_69290 [Bradyrhizobium diazoefficiens]BCE33093.1 hypothetical protein XF2B_68620 [Bradyrhizobium diazoefficiens]